MVDVRLTSVKSSFPLLNASFSFYSLQRGLFFSDKQAYVVVNPTVGVGGSRFGLVSSRRFPSLKVCATVAESNQPKWWEKNVGPNMIDIHSTQEFLNALSQAGDRLFIVEFYGTWCASCRALFPKLCKTAQEHPDILFLKVNFDENKPMCKSLNVKVLPYFHFYRGVQGLVESFSCSLAKFQKIKDAIETHSVVNVNNGPLRRVGELTLDSIAALSEERAGKGSS